MNENLGTKKKRETNFSVKEERQLVSLVKKYASVIENKKTDSEMNRRKNLIWQQLTKDFNTYLGDTFRSTDSLKSKYLNLKKNAKKKYADEKKYSYGTGGGPHVKVMDSPIDSQIHEIIGTQMTGFETKFDGDRTEFLDENVAVIVEEDASEMEVTEDQGSKLEFSETILNEEAPSTTTDWSKQSVEALRTPVSKKLQDSGTRKRDNFLKTKLGNWAKAKQNVATFQHQFLLEEQKQKLAHNEEKHKLDMEQKKELHQQTMLFAKEEHEGKLRILKLEEEKLRKELL